MFLKFQINLGFEEFIYKFIFHESIKKSKKKIKIK